MHFHNQISQDITSLEGQAKSDIELFRRILIRKRLDMVKNQLAATNKSMGSRFSGLFEVYSLQHWPKADALLFDDALAFYDWLENLSDPEITKHLDQLERNWFAFLKTERKFQIRICRQKKFGFILQVMYRRAWGPQQFSVEFF